MKKQIMKNKKLLIIIFFIFLLVIGLVIYFLSKNKSNDNSHKKDNNDIKKECKNNCNNRGICDTNTGMCICDKDLNLDDDCETCINNLYDPNNSCKTCINNNYDPNNGCKTCINNYDLTNGCKTCINNLYDLNNDCKTCINNLYNPTNGCKTCINNNYDPNNACKACINRDYDPTNDCKTCLLTYFTTNVGNIKWKLANYDTKGNKTHETESYKVCKTEKPNSYGLGCDENCNTCTLYFDTSDEKNKIISDTGGGDIYNFDKSTNSYIRKFKDNTGEEVEVRIFPTICENQNL